MTTSPTERHALVIGAGLAGAAVCVALTRRHWRTTLIDAAEGPAQAASALPVGMLSPHVTRAPTPLSRLSALGVADTLEQLKRLVPEGAGWQACEVDNLGHDPGRWPAALVRPAALVQAWLAQAQAAGLLQTAWKAPVQRLVRSTCTDGSAVWQARATDGRVLAQAPVAVVAAACGSLDLLTDGPGLEAQALPLRPVQGQMSLAALDGEPLMPRPQRDNGVFVPQYEDRGLPPRWPARIWAMGSTYERGLDSTALSEAAHRRNAQSLQTMHPVAARRLQDALDAGHLLGWAQVRCASLDRLPLMGALPDLVALERLMAASGHRRGRVPLSDVPRLAGLYTLCALGSRGLTLAHWCATQLAAQMDDQSAINAGEGQDLIDALDPARFAWRLARRQQPAATINPA